MATLIGVVRQVVGEVFAVAGDGTRRPLAEGDRVYAGEQLVTGADGSIAITLAGGGEMTLGRGSSQMLDTQILAEAHNSNSAQEAAAPPTAPSQQDLTDVQKLQAAIEAGVDPTQVGEATAAGPGAGGAGGAGGIGGGHSFVLLGETGDVVDPTIGYPTGPISSAPEFPTADIPPAPDEIPVVIVPDFIPELEVEYQDSEGQIVVGPGVVDEEALS
ncbi:MAG: retention module-containing protein, partial [Pseudomonadaceae bacterium]|nr:retention module-containing protein [Pseudomonadaceae bacterium]